MKKLKKCSWKKYPKCGSEEILYSERERKKNGLHEWGRFCCDAVGYGASFATGIVIRNKYVNNMVSTAIGNGLKDMLGLTIDKLDTSCMEYKFVCPSCGHKWKDTSSKTSNV